MKKNSAALVIIMALLFVTANIALANDAKVKAIAHKSGYESAGTFNGPNSTVGELEREDRVSTAHYIFPAIDETLKPWFDWKRALNDDHNFQLGTYYTTLYQSINNALPGTEANAASGILRINGKWELTGRGTKNTGSLVFNIDQRHKIGTNITPAALASSAGYAGVTGTLFSDVGLVLVDLTWQQVINDGQGGFIVGRFDPNDYIAVSGYASPWTGFQNAAVVLNASIALPDASYGIGFGHRANESIYFLGTVNDANGTLTDYSFFSEGSELFSSIEMGWSPNQSKRYTNAFNITLWNADERSKAGIAKSDGVAISGNWLFDNGMMPIFRAGWSNGTATSAPIYSSTYTLGLVYNLKSISDVVGLAVNWGENKNNGLPKDQLTTEIYYNWSVTQNINITPSAQWLVDPALNTNDDEVWIFGLRMRITL